MTRDMPQTAPVTAPVLAPVFQAPQQMVSLLTVPVPVVLPPLGERSVTLPTLPD